MKKFLAPLVSAAMLSALPGVSPAQEAAAREEILYLFPGPENLPAFAPFQIARSKGYFEQAGLDVTFQTAKGGADAAKQVAVGNADFGGGIGDTPIIVRPNGLDIRGVALLGGRGLTQLAWRADSGITGPQDFRGKSVGVLSFETTTYYSLLGVLAAEGMTDDDVDIQAVGSGGVVQLAISGDLQAISGVPEWIASIEAAGVDMEQMPADEIFPSMAQAIIASDETIEERPEVVRGFVGAVLKAVQEIKDDPAQATLDYVAAVPQHKGNEAEIEAVLTAYATLVYPEGEGQPLGSFDPARVAELQEFYVSNGIARSAVPVEDLYTNAFVQ